jgi:hypothetical protein
MEISEGNLQINKNIEKFPKAHPGGSGGEDQKYKKVPDPSPRAEIMGKGKNVSGEGRGPSPGRKLPPRTTIKRRSAPQTPCSDQTRGPEPSPGGQGWVDPQNPMGKPAENPVPWDDPEQNTPVLPPVAPLTRASDDPLAPPSGWEERVGKMGGESACPARPPAKCRPARGSRARGPAPARKRRGRRATW